MRYGKESKGGEELYDMKVDPQQFTNLATIKSARSQLEKMRANLDQALTR